MRHYLDWEKHLNKSKSKNTVKVYLSDIIGIDSFLLKNGINGLLDDFITSQDISCYFKKIDDEKSDSTFNRKISSIQGFLDFYSRGDRMPDIERKKTKSTKVFEQKVESSQIAIFYNLQAPPIRNEYQASLWSRDKLMLLMLWLTDIQVEDLLNLKIHNILEGNKAISIDGELVLLPLIIQISLAEWLINRAKTITPDIDQLFTSPMKNSAMTKVGLHLRLNKHSKRLNLPNNRVRNRVNAATMYR